MQGPDSFFSASLLVRVLWGFSIKGPPAEVLLGRLQSSSPPDLSSFELPASEMFFKKATRVSDLCVKATLAV